MLRQCVAVVVAVVVHMVSIAESAEFFSNAVVEKHSSFSKFISIPELTVSLPGVLRIVCRQRYTMSSVYSRKTKIGRKTRNFIWPIFLHL